MEIDTRKPVTKKCDLLDLFTKGILAMRQILLLPLLLSFSLGEAQTPEKNLMKYWKHRDQLSQFVFQGQNVNPTTEHGSYLVAEYRFPWMNCSRSFQLGNGVGQALLDTLSYDNLCGGLSFQADATMLLGWYIGVLATEYRLLKNHGQPTAATERELWGALKAYERLDRMAEGLFEGHEPSLNGYFVRDDVLPFFADDKFKADGTPYFDGIRCTRAMFAGEIAAFEPVRAQQNNPSVDPWDVTVTDGTAWINSPSPDQVLGLLLGFSLVKACVDEGASYNGESLLGLAQQYAHLIGTYAKDHNWEMVTPNGENQGDRTMLVMFSSPISAACRWISGNQHHYGNSTNDMLWGPLWANMTQAYANDFEEGDTLFTEDGIPLAAFIAASIVPTAAIVASPLVPFGSLPVDPLLMFAAGMVIGNYVVPDTFWIPVNPVSVSQMLTAAAISNDWNGSELRNVKAREWGMELFPLLTDVIYNTSDISPTTKAQCRQMIDEAPCEKFCSCTGLQAYDSNINPCSFNAYNEYGCISAYHCDAAAGWESSNRYLHRNHQTGSQSGSEHNGLDFLLLYNLYHLKYPEELPLHYVNNYQGVYHHTGTYPLPEMFVEEVENLPSGANFNCMVCEESPMAFVSNDIIRSNAQIGSLEGFTWIWDPPTPSTAATFVGDATFRAGEEIVFADGFSVLDGASMHAYIEPFECVGGMLMRLGEEEYEDEAIDESIPIQSLEIERKSVLYPNPTTGLLTLQHPQTILQMEAFDAYGRMIARTTPNSNTGTIGLSGNAAGIYMLRATLEDGSTETHRAVLAPQ